MSIITKIKEQLFSLYIHGNDKLLLSLYSSPNILSSEETIDKIIQDRCSVSRFGDGEFHLLTQSKDLIFQKKSETLSNRLQEILKSNMSNHLVCIPKVFTNKELAHRTEESRKFWKQHVANNRMKWYSFLKMEKTYYNSSFTRHYIAIEDKSRIDNYFKKVKEIWKNRDLLIVEGEFSRLGVNNDLFNNAKTIQRILAPNEHAFEKYELIFNEVSKHSTDKLVLIALGPTATVLSYDLHRKGYQAIDIGHLDVEYEWFIQKTLVKTKIENKYVIEANQITAEDSFINEQYQNQISCRII